MLYGMGKALCETRYTIVQLVIFSNTLTSRQVLYTGRFIMFSVITNIYNKKTKGPSLKELFAATGKLKRFFDS
jgi:hypothetical protein